MINSSAFAIWCVLINTPNLHLLLLFLILAFILIIYVLFLKCFLSMFSNSDGNVDQFVAEVETPPTMSTGIQEVVDNEMAEVAKSSCYKNDYGQLDKNSRCNIQPSLCNSPASLLKIIMNHVFKTSRENKENVYHSPQPRRLSQLELIFQEPQKTKLGSSLDIEDPFSSTANLDFDVSQYFEAEEDPSPTDPMVKQYITHRKLKKDFYSPKRLEQQDFLFNSLETGDALATYLSQEDNEKNNTSLHQNMKEEDDNSSVQHLSGSNFISLECKLKLPISENKRSYVCRICGKEFLKRYSLDRHLVTQACIKAQKIECRKLSDNSWECSMCPSNTFTSKKEATSHLVSHKIEPRSCPICEERFKHLTDTDLLQHVRKHHPDFLS